MRIYRQLFLSFSFNVQFLFLGFENLFCNGILGIFLFLFLLGSYTHIRTTFVILKYIFFQGSSFMSWLDV